ncbi:rhodanese-like domain-containing protein [Kitasatospora paranensis]|uniref:Rhodanese-like domain-containing protein n=1 Tax=Kitasatospora paranensis TaxID=258053 RepID=A0ABW2G4A0_9ACTN
MATPLTVEQLRPAAATQAELTVVCASGTRSRSACEKLAAAGVTARPLVGGTSAWAQDGRPLNRPEGARAVWAMDRQVRPAAGSLVVAGVGADLALPGARWPSAAVGAGLACAAIGNTCAMGAMLGKLPHNRPHAGLRGPNTVLAGLPR